jgi:hypothetical protein
VDAPVVEGDASALDRDAHFRVGSTFGASTAVSADAI